MIVFHLKIIFVYINNSSNITIQHLCYDGGFHWAIIITVSILIHWRSFHDIYTYGNRLEIWEENRKNKSVKQVDGQSLTYWQQLDHRTVSLLGSKTEYYHSDKRQRDCPLVNWAFQKVRPKGMANSVSLRNPYSYVCKIKLTFVKLLPHQNVSFPFIVTDRCPRVPGKFQAEIW